MRSLTFALAAIASLALLVGQPARSADDKSFFNGKDLEGFEGLTEFWSVKDAAILGATPADGIKFNTFLCSKKKYKDFELKFQVRLKDGKGNSGIQIRSEITDPKKFVVRGPQADIGAGYWGSLYGEAMTDPDTKKGVGMMKAAPAAEVNKVLKKDDFNEYHIKAVGKKVTIKVNGVTTVDEEFKLCPEEGIIAFQLHSGPQMEVTFKNIEFKELK